MKDGKDIELLDIAKSILEINKAYLIDVIDRFEANGIEGKLTRSDIEIAFDKLSEKLIS
jgi:hypothetical protein